MTDFYLPTTTISLHGHSFECPADSTIINIFKMINNDDIYCSLCVMDNPHNHRSDVSFIFTIDNFSDFLDMLVRKANEYDIENDVSRQIFRRFKFDTMCPSSHFHVTCQKPIGDEDGEFVILVNYSVRFAERFELESDLAAFFGIAQQS